MMKKLLLISIIMMPALFCIGCWGPDEGNSSKGDIGQAVCRHEATTCVTVAAETGGYKTQYAYGPTKDNPGEFHLQGMALVRITEDGTCEPCNPVGFNGCQWEYLYLHNGGVFVGDQDSFYNPTEIWDSDEYISSRATKVQIINDRRLFQ